MSAPDPFSLEDVLRAEAAVERQKAAQMRESAHRYRERSREISDSAHRAEARAIALEKAAALLTQMENA